MFAPSRLFAGALPMLLLAPLALLLAPAVSAAHDGIKFVDTALAVSRFPVSPGNGIQNQRFVIII